MGFCYSSLNWLGQKSKWVWRRSLSALAPGSEHLSSFKISIRNIMETSRADNQMGKSSLIPGTQSQYGHCTWTSLSLCLPYGKWEIHPIRVKLWSYMVNSYLSWQLFLLSLQEPWASECWAMLLGEICGFMFLRPLGHNISSTDQHITLFYVHIYLKTS